MPKQLKYGRKVEGLVLSYCKPSKRMSFTQANGKKTSGEITEYNKEVYTTGKTSI